MRELLWAGDSALSCRAVPCRACVLTALRLASLRSSHVIGIDACSPGEVKLALSAGTPPAAISVTASFLSEKDLAFFVSSEVHCNVDSVSALRRYATALARAGRVEGSTGHNIGLRFNPQVLTGYGVTDVGGYSITASAVLDPLIR